MASTAYEVASALNAACDRHPGLDWVIVNDLPDRPYWIDRHHGHPTIYVNGLVATQFATAALLAAINELDQTTMPVTTTRTATVHRAAAARA